MAFGLFKKTKKADIIIYNGVIMTQNPDPVSYTHLSVFMMLVQTSHNVVAQYAEYPRLRM